MAKASTSIILDTRRLLNSGNYPVKLRVTFERKSKYFDTEEEFTEEEFNKIMAPKPRGEYKTKSLELEAMEKRANDVIGKLPVFSFEAFAKRYASHTVKEDVFDAYEEAMERLRSDGQVGTAKNYESAYVSLLSFVLKEPGSRNKGLTMKEAAAKRDGLFNKRKPLHFSAVTQDFLKEYDKWMVLNGRSLTTISMYLRTLRTLFNEAIAAGDVLQDLYPFGKRKYQVPAGKNTKKALSKQDLDKIFLYAPKSEAEERARDLWCFSFLCNGINIKDIARLRYKQVSGNSISFVRAKTERTTRHAQKSINIQLVPKAAKIIERWGNKPASADSFVFPVLREGLTPEKEMALVKQAIKTINKYMDRICLELGIEMKVRTYAARHSFSTLLKRGGIPTAQISEALGHSSEKTTQSYLDSFDDEAKQRMASLLTEF